MPCAPVFTLFRRLIAQLAAKEDPQLVRDFRESDWFCEGGKRAKFVEPISIGPRQDDDRNGSNRRIATLRATKSETAHDGHLQVQHDRGRAAAGSQLGKRLLTILRFDHAKALQPQ